MTHKHDLDVPKSCYRCDPIVSITQLILPPAQHLSVKTADATGRIATHGFCHARETVRRHHEVARPGKKAACLLGDLAQPVTSMRVENQRGRTQLLPRKICLEPCGFEPLVASCIAAGAKTMALRQVRSSSVSCPWPATDTATSPRALRQSRIRSRVRRINCPRPAGCGYRDVPACRRTDRANRFRRSRLRA
jgi:hypothetical protein